MIRKSLSFLLCVVLVALPALAGTINGRLATPSGGPVLNATISFTLNSPNTVSGSFSVAVLSTACFTDSVLGSVVGIPDPSPGSIKFQGGILNSGTGFQHVRQAAGCTTAAAVNARCTVTVNWPATWNDTNYTATCTIGSVTNPVLVEWTGNFTTTSLQVILGNTADSAASATGTIHCIGVHD